MFKKLIFNSTAVYISGYILPGVSFSDLTTVVIVTLLLGVLNVLIKPILVLVTLPINILTLGLFTLVINGLLILLLDYLVIGFSVENLFWGILFSITVSVINTGLSLFLD